MFLTVDELYTHLHDETVAVISRDTEAIPVAAIDAAIAEAKSYLHDFDTAAIFSAEGEARNALLLLFVKDIAVWHFVNLGNACIDMELREKRYDSAIVAFSHALEITPDRKDPLWQQSQTRPALLSC